MLSVYSQSCFHPVSLPRAAGNPGCRPTRLYSARGRTNPHYQNNGPISQMAINADASALHGVEIGNDLRFRIIPVSTEHIDVLVGCSNGESTWAAEPSFSGARSGRELPALAPVFLSRAEPLQRPRPQLSTMTFNRRPSKAMGGFRSGPLARIT